MKGLTGIFFTYVLVMCACLCSNNNNFLKNKKNTFSFVVILLFWKKCNYCAALQSCYLLQVKKKMVLNQS